MAEVHPDMERALRALARGESLSRREAAAVMALIMDGQATGAQFGAFVMGLLLKGETVDEIAGLASVMRERAVAVEAPAGAVDTCGTGGDGSDSFNVSTVAAFVAAAAGATVAKHGNRAMSSQCGSADVLEAMGAEVMLDARQVEQVLGSVGIAFMFAPLFHPAMKHAVPHRRELRVRTVFNILGPLTNPAAAGHQVIGVADGTIAPLMAEVLRELGSRHALVVHGTDGLDEISIAAPTKVWELRDGRIDTWEVHPTDVGLHEAPLDDLRGGDRDRNAAIARAVLQGEDGPGARARREVVALNAAAALVAADVVGSLQDGVERALEALEGGAALRRLDAFTAATRDAAGAVTAT